MVFVGVTTGRSLINRIFPVWAEIMGIAPARLEGMDLPLDRIVARDRRHAHPRAEALVLGSGGAGLALAAHLIERTPAERPRGVILSDVDGERLAHAESSLNTLGGRGVVAYRQVQGSADTDRLVAVLPSYSLVVNATGLGKDRPGSPISDAARFPDHGIVWEFNYRGPRRFLAQAREQHAERHLTVADGWTYFLYGWAHVIAEVFGIVLDETLFARLEAAAESVR